MKLWQELWEAIAKRVAGNAGTGRNTFAETMAALASTVAIAIVTSENESHQDDILEVLVNDIRHSIPRAKEMLEA